MRFALAKHGFAITTGASRSKLGDQIQFSFKQRRDANLMREIRVPFVNRNQVGK